MNGDTRHIPEEELHAYLDQALSRSQCVEIECHLAVCYRCADLRGQVAAARDRITALLALAAPIRPSVAPSFDTLVARRQGQSVRRGRQVARAAAIAASLVGALAAGWMSRGFLLQDLGAPADLPVEAALPAVDEPSAEQPPADERTLVALAPPTLDEPGAALEVPAREPAREAPDVGVVRVASDATPLTIQVSTFDPVDDGSGMLDGLWQTVDWYEAWTLTGGNVPHVDGLPVVAVQIQRGAGDARPVVVVSQQHPSGRVIRTIEGPVERVAALVEGRLGSRVNASAASFTPPDYLATDGVARRGLRILTVTGALPADSLTALAKEIALRD